ncbi:MAG: LysR family transcriptional regulator [Gloeobacteraceae cyanobacterium ES-bin-144]|nr:LysR family transcriptional regulator [Verrucomicrobiales bacterium]
MEVLPEAGFLNYHHLRYFWTVATEGSLRRASEKLRVSQPSMCTQIKLLEASLGETLFRPSGRSLELTEFGQLVCGYAEEIFTLGGEILRTTKQAPGVRSLRLHVGIVDSFPKLMSYDILRPVLEHEPPVQLTCHEGKLADLVSQLNTHRIDVVLSDEPISPGIAGKAFNNLLGTSDVTFCAMPGFAKKLKGRFPRNLDGAAALLPTHNCNLRRDLEKFFGSIGVQPCVVAEFEDAALTKIVATSGKGFIAVPTVVESEVVERYGFVLLGRTKEVQTQFYAITAERRFTHPAIIAITKKLRTARKKTKA